MTDDEKFFYQSQDGEDAQPLSWFQEAAIENARDIIACGFDLERTFIFRDMDYIQQLYPNVVHLQSLINYNQVKGIFGFTGSENVGKVGFGAIQAAPCIASCFTEVFQTTEDLLCLIPCGIDQDPYFRLTRDLAPRLKFPKPCTLYSKFFPALQGHDKKMSSSDPNSSIFLTDSFKEIENKIKKHAFSGGQADLKTHQEKGANLEVDVSIAYLDFFLDDDQKLQDIKDQYKSGHMLTSQVKQILVEVLQNLVGSHQKARELATREVVFAFMKVRKLKA
jgi:tryptophanyl-tRNA synthetase